MLRGEFPKLYPILDKATLDARGVRVACFAREMARAGVGVLQYRDKVGSPQDVLRGAALIADAFTGQECLLILNDRPDLAVLAGWHGVHVGHRDMLPADVLRVLKERRFPAGMTNPRASVVGVSTHCEEQVLAADAGCADYVAVGPVFATSSKADAEPVVGLAGLRLARSLTQKPIVAIGGITLENARSVIDAGADSVAVIGGMFVRGVRPGRVAEDFLEILR